MKKLFKFITALVLISLFICFVGNLSCNEINEDTSTTTLASSTFSERALSTKIEAIESITITADSYEQTQTQYDSKLPTNYAFLNFPYASREYKLNINFVDPSTITSIELSHNGIAVTDLPTDYTNFSMDFYHDISSLVEVKPYGGQFYIDKFVIKVNGEIGNIQILKVEPEDDKQLGDIHITAVRGEEEVVICNTFTSSTLHMNYPDGLDKLPVTFDSIKIDATPKSSKSSVDVYVNKVRKTEHQFCSNPSDKVLLEASIINEQKLTIEVKVRSEAGNIQTYTGTIIRGTADANTEFRIEDEKYTYLDPNGMEQELPFELKILTRVTETGETEIINITNVESLMKYSTTKASFKIVPTSPTTKIYIGGEDYTNIPFETEIKNEASFLTKRLKLTVRSQKQQILRPDNTLAGDFETNIDLSSSGPETEKTIQELSLKHFMNDTLISDASNTTFDKDLRLYKFILKKSLCGETFKFNIILNGEYAKAYISESDDSDSMNSVNNLYNSDTVWPIGNTIYIFVLSQSGGSDWLKYTVETEFADERSEENGIENITFKNGEDEVTVNFNEGTLEYPNISFPYSVKQLTVEITLKDVTEALVDGADFIFAELDGTLKVVVTINLIEGENTFKIQAKSEKEIVGSLYQFKFTRLAGSKENDITSLTINGIDCSSPDNLNVHYNKVFSKDSLKFSYYTGRGNNEFTFDVVTSVDSQFTICSKTRTDSFRVEDGTYQEFIINVKSETEIVDETAGKDYTIRIYVADQENKLEDLKLYTDDTKEFEVLDQDGKHFMFSKNNAFQTKFNVKFKTRNAYFLPIKDSFHGKVLYNQEELDFVHPFEVEFSTGSNQLKFEVLSELAYLADGDENITAKGFNYTLTISRAFAKTIAELESLAISIDGVSVPFTSNEVEMEFQEEVTGPYTAEYVSTTAKTLEISANPKDEDATILEELTQTIDLSGDKFKQEFTITVVAEDGVTDKVYRIVLWRTRANASEDNEIHSFTAHLDSNPLLDILNPKFNKDVTNYVIEVPYNDEASVFITINEHAVLYVHDGTSTDPVEGENGRYRIPHQDTNTEKSYVIYVVSEVGVKGKEYTITVRKSPDIDATLKELNINGEPLDGFTAGMEGASFTYLAGDLDTVTISATPNQSNATVTNLNNPYPLEVGDNRIDIIVLAEDNKTSQTYTIVVVKDAPALLDELEIVAEEDKNLLTPVFVPNTLTGYMVNIKYSNQYLIFKCRTAYNTCKIMAPNGREYVSNTEEIKVENIEVGTSQYRIEVSTRSGVKQTYSIEVTKEAANTDATLSEFFINDEVVTGFTSGMNGGTFEVFIKDADTVKLRGTLTDANASIASNPCETPVDTVVGENVYVLTTVAEDGITTCEYRITAIKDAPKTLEELSLKLENEEQILNFDSANFKYSIFLDYGQDSLVLAFRRTNETLTNLKVLDPNLSEINAIGDEYILTGIQAGVSTYKIRIIAASGEYQDYDLEITSEEGSDINTIESFAYYEIPGDTTVTSLEIQKDTTTYKYVVDRSSTIFNPVITLTDEKSTLTMPADVNLIAGTANEKEVIVTSQTGISKTYKFIVYPCDIDFTLLDLFVKESDSDDNLLSVDGTYIDFKHNILEIEVPSHTASMKLDVLKQSEHSFVYVNDSVLTDEIISLNSGENIFNIAVYSEYAKENPDAIDYISDTVTIKVTVVVDPIITITTEGIDGQSPLKETIPYGDSKSVVVSKQGYTILSLEIDGINQTEIKDEYFFENVREDHAIRIVYEKNTYKVTVSVLGNGGAYVNEEKIDHEISFLFGDTIKFKFIPDEGYKLTGIQIDGKKVSVTNELNIGTIDNHTLELTFEIIKYKITYEIEGEGTITPELNEIEYNQSITYSITPAEGKKIKEVIVDHISKGEIDSFTLENIKEDHTIQVIFEDVKYVVKLEKQGLGRIDPENNLEYVYGSTPIYHFTPEEGYHIESILVNDIALGEEDLANAIANGYTLESLKSDVTLTVIFEENKYIIEVEATENGTITPSQEAYSHGTTASILIQPNEGFHILEIKVDEVRVDLSSYSEEELKQGITYTLENMVANHTIEVVFDGNNTTYKIYHRFQDLELNYGEKIFVEEKTAKVNEEVTVKPQVIPGFEAEPVLPFKCLPNGESELVISYYRLEFEISYEESPGIKSVKGFGRYLYDTEIEIEVELSIGYHFNAFISSNEALVSGATTNPYTFKVPAGNVKFSLDLIRYNTIQIKEIKNGIMDIEPGIYEYSKGESLTIHFRPYEGYVLKDLIIDGVKVSPLEESSYTFENISSNHTFELVFEQITFTLTVTIHGTTATFVEEHYIPYGTKYVYTVVPVEGYDLGSIYVDGVYISNGDTTFEFDEVKEEHAIEVTISQIFYTIRVNIKGEGRVSPAGDNLVTHGSDRVLSFIPETGYRIKDVIIDNRSLGPITTYTFTRVTFDHRVEVEFEQMMFRIHINTPENGRIDYEGSLVLPYASNQELSFIPNEGYKIKDVQINGRSVGTLEGYTFLNIQEDQNVVVEFEEITYKIEININGKGSVTPDIVNIVGYKQDITFTFLPELGYEVTRLAIDGEVIGSASEYSFHEVLSDHLISVEFDPTIYTITIQSTGVGTFNSDLVTEVLYNANKDIIFTTDQAHRIKLLELDGEPVIGTNKISLRNITENHTIVVEFEQIFFTITVTNVIGNGTVTPGDSIEVPYGDNKNYSFTPDDGYKIKEIKIDGKGIEIVNSYMFYNVTDNHTVSVEFEKMLHTIQVICGEGGTTTLPAENILEHRSELMCRFSPNQGFRVKEILVDGESVGAIESYFFGNISTDHTIEVIFEEILFSFTIYFGPEGTVTYPTEDGPVKPSDKVYVRSETDFVLDIETKDKYRPKIMINGEKVDSTNRLEFKAVDKDYFIQVEFVELLHLEISKEGNGTIPESADYEWRTPVTLVFKPEVGHKVKEVLVDGKSVGSVEDYTFPTLVVDHTVVVIFEPIQYKVSYKLYGKGTVEGSVDLNAITYGQSCDIIITPDEGWQLSIVFVDGEEAKIKDGKVVVENVKDDVELVVYISEIPVKSIPMWIFIVLGIIILILFILLIVVSIWNRKRRDRYRY